MRLVFSLLVLFMILSCKQNGPAEPAVSGELMRWHKVTLSVPGPQVSEWDRQNPFLDYRLDVVFSRNGRELVVPGYFAADGRAGATSADAGNIWKAHFRPDESGMWEYRIHFRTGRDVAVRGFGAGAPAGLDGYAGSFEVRPSDKAGTDFRARGRIVNGKRGYFRFQGDGELWIKNGADSPENFLAYAGFDQTRRYDPGDEVREGEADPSLDLHRYGPHLADWNEGDPDWGGGLGRGIIGALNYLHSAGVNSVYMLTMNIQGDGKDVWPYNDHNERYRFDCSKLDQWEAVFDHMDSLGMMMHLVLQETENECLLDMGYTKVQRRVYLRELVARFGHHLGVTWNLGEENGPADWTPIGQTDAQRKEMAAFLKKTNPYPSPVVVHTHSDDFHQEAYLEPLLGFEHLDGPSMQIADPPRVNERVARWVEASEKAGKRWVVCLDEIGPHWNGVLPDAVDPGHDTLRRDALWGALMAGAAGVEWYFGYRHPHNDLDCEDFRSRENWWRQSTLATEFMQAHNLEKMEARYDLVQPAGSWCLATPGEVYIAYFTAGTASCRLFRDEDTDMEIRWFNPLEGGGLQAGTLPILSGSGWKELGIPPGSSTGKLQADWVAVIR